MKINENLVAIKSSSIPIPIELKMGEDLLIVVSGTVIKIEDCDNQDGTINRTYKVKGVVGEVVKDGTIITNIQKEIW